MATILRRTLVCFTSDMGNDLVHQFKPLYTADGDEMLPISTEGGLEINADDLLRLPQQLHLAQFHHEHAPGSVRKSVQHIEPLMESAYLSTLQVGAAAAGDGVTSEEAGAIKPPDSADTAAGGIKRKLDSESVGYNFVNPFGLEPGDYDPDRPDEDVPMLHDGAVDQPGTRCTQRGVSFTPRSFTDRRDG